MSNNFRATIVPEYLTQVAQEIKDQSKKDRIAKFNKEQKDKFKSGRVAVRWAAKNMSLIDHGFGVREDIRTGSVWHVEGEELIRQDSDEDIEAIIASLEN